MTALKEVKIVLQCVRNIKDGLWDIPVHKQILYTNNFEILTTHPALHRSHGQNLPKEKYNIVCQQK